MEKITKEQFETAKSNVAKRNTIELVLNTSKLVLDVAASLGDDVFNTTIVAFRDKLNDIAEVVFDNVDKIVCDDEKPKKD